MATITDGTAVFKVKEKTSREYVDEHLPLSGGTMTGALTLADGGTALSNNATAVSVSDYITALSGYSIRGAVLRVIGGVFIRARIGINFNTSVSANSTVSVATISKPYRPPANAGAFGGTMDGVMTIDADGSVRVKPASNKTSGSWMWADVFYSLI